MTLYYTIALASCAQSEARSVGKRSICVYAHSLPDDSCVDLSIGLKPLVNELSNPALVMFSFVRLCSLLAG